MYVFIQQIAESKQIESNQYIFYIYINFRRESGAEVMTIEETADGKIDLADLEEKLFAQYYRFVFPGLFGL